MENSENIRFLLRWLFARDLPRYAVVTGSRSSLTKSPRETQIIQWNDELSQASIGLPAQLLALGIEHVYVEVDESDAASVAQFHEWENVTPGLVSQFQGFRRFFRRGDDVLVVGSIPLPRRVILGFTIAENPPFSFVGDDVDRTIRALELLRSQGRIGALSGLENKLGGARLGVTACTACGVCVRACPHDALEMVDREKSSVLLHHVDLCRNENRCVSLCPEQGIWVQGEVTLSDLLEDKTKKLFTVTTARCEKCGARHPENEGSLCKVCQFKELSPFGSITISR
ncbi:4Fe-4S dicluster domain-containing protein [Arcanobacterium ihumii]|uniref:4Fe-4S dicluster domain-containing protein n=1 Tax=Arcanobacterium ihumii TaxID=2138162 RepID=UPI001356FCD4|nr:4Fe-4S dicluster domain-containing protein [Arcanobacterium ihumii]